MTQEHTAQVHTGNNVNVSVRVNAKYFTGRNNCS